MRSMRHVFFLSVRSSLGRRVSSFALILWLLQSFYVKHAFMTIPQLLDVLQAGCIPV